MRYIKPLTQQEIHLLETHYKSSPSHRERERSKALLMSHQGKNIKMIAQYLELDRDTISAWLSRWEKRPVDADNPLSSLSDGARCGRPSILSEDKKKV